MLPMPKALCLHAVKSCWIMRAEHKLPDAYELDDSQQKKSKNTLEKNTLLQIPCFIKVEKNKYKAAALEVIFYVFSRKAAVDSERLQNNESMSQVKVASPQQL